MRKWKQGKQETLESLPKEISEAQLKEARKLADEWLANHPK